jgi:long-chain acyl-CoA synthetase
MVYDPALFKEIHKLNKEEEIKEFLDEKIKEINKTMPNYKFIKEVYVTTEPLIKTTTLKIKRFEEMKKMGIDITAKNKPQETEEDESQEAVSK